MIAEAEPKLPQKSRKKLVPQKKERRMLVSILHGQTLHTHRALAVPSVHLIIGFQAVISQVLARYPSDSRFEVSFRLYQASSDLYLSEGYAVHVGNTGILSDLSRFGSAKTIFRVGLEATLQEKLLRLFRESPRTGFAREMFEWCVVLLWRKNHLDSHFHFHLEEKRL